MIRVKQKASKNYCFGKLIIMKFISNLVFVCLGIFISKAQTLHINQVGFTPNSNKTFVIQLQDSSIRNYKIIDLSRAY